MKVLVAQLCPTLSNPMDCSPPGLEFSRQEYWSGIPSPEDPSDPGIKPRSPAWQTDSLLSEPPGKPIFPGEGKLAKWVSRFEKIAQK